MKDPDWLKRSLEFHLPVMYQRRGRDKEGVVVEGYDIILS